MKPSHASWGGTSIDTALRREVDVFEFEASLIHVESFMLGLQSANPKKIVRSKHHRWVSG